MKIKSLRESVQFNLPWWEEPANTSLLTSFTGSQNINTDLGGASVGCSPNVRGVVVNTLWARWPARFPARRYSCEIKKDVLINEKDNIESQ